MKKFFLTLIAGILILSGLVRYSLEFEGPQDTALKQLSRVVVQQNAQGIPNPDSLRIFVCGSASPLGTTDRAQACIAVVTPSHFYIVDSGAGSTDNISRARLPVDRLRGVFLTHHHSDHIAELYELNLSSWVQGRPEPLTVFGPKGVRRIVNGVNDTYELDREYRIEHHGADLLVPDLGELNYRTVKAGVVLEDGDLKVTAYRGDHSPVKPALGYRFDYRGRSVVISGDSLVTDETRRVSAKVDLVLHDALSIAAVTTLADTADDAGLSRLAKIMRDVLDYHAPTESIGDLAISSGAGLVGLYHLVPTPQNFVMENIFLRNMPENVTLVDDGDWFELPVGSKNILTAN